MASPPPPIPTERPEPPTRLERGLTAACNVMVLVIALAAMVSVAIILVSLAAAAVWRAFA